MSNKNTYSLLIESIFRASYKKGLTQIPFKREDITAAAKKLKVQLPKNLGDVIYSFRYRTTFPESIKKTAPKGSEWVIKPKGKALYEFTLVKEFNLLPAENLAETKVLDSTPGIIGKYQLSDEQALLAKVRYNRLIDIFTGLTCYSLQNHLRTTVQGIGQIETDEIYIGVDKRGAHYILPIQAKGGTDKIGIVQIEQDFALCASKYPTLICKPIAAQFMKNGAIALFEFEKSDDEIKITSEKHYSLVSPTALSESELEKYRTRAF